MKKTKLLCMFAAVACAAVFLLALTGCGDAKSNFVGTWNLESLQDPDMGTFSASDLSAYGLSNMTLELKDDGKGSYGMFGNTRDLTWEAKSATEATITIGQDQPATFTLKDKKLTGTLFEMTLTFTKKS